MDVDFKDPFVKAIVGKNLFHMKPVDIIIPFSDNHAKVVKTVENCFVSIKNNYYSLVLVDDCSKYKKFSDYFKKYKTIKFINFKEKVGYVNSINEAIKQTIQPYVCVIHPGVVGISTNWLGNLGESLIDLKKSSVKMITPLMNSVKPKEDEILVENDINYDCFLCHRKLFEEVGLLTESPNEFHKNMKSKGYKQAICGTSLVKLHI